MLKTLHVTLAYVTVIGFVLRVGWSYVDAEKLRLKPVRILPHVIDTVLLIAGVGLAFSLSVSLADSWLVAKLLALLAYIGFGVLTLRGSGVAKMAGLLGAALSLVYLFMVAYDKTPWPF